MGEKPKPLANESLEEAIKIMQDIIGACRECIDKDVSWSMACRDHGLNPFKVRQHVILNLDKFTEIPMLLENIDLKMYDGYEEFYRYVFGERNLEHASLPYDYKESVAHVLKNTGMDQREALVLMRHFGIVDYDTPESFEAIGDSLDIHKDRAFRIGSDGLRRCRERERMSVLRQGLAKYELLARQAKELHEQEMKQRQFEHEAMLARRSRDHGETMDAINSGTYEEAMSRVLPDGLPESLKFISVDEMDLNVRQHNALARNGINDIYGLLQKADLSTLMGLRHMGPKSAGEILAKLDAYTEKNFCMPASELRNKLFG